jgi:hypothetical protein
LLTPEKEPCSVQLKFALDVCVILQVVPPPERPYPNMNATITNRPRKNNNRKRRGKPRRNTNLARYAQISDRQVHKIFCSEQYTTNFVPNTGFGAISPSMVFAVEQAGVLYAFGSGSWNSVPFNNYASLASVFQEFRILEFSVETFVSINTAISPASQTSFFPVLYAVTDHEDGNPITSTTQALQYPSCKVTQLGSTQGPKTVTIKGPTCAGYVDVGTGPTSSTPGVGQALRSPWMTCGTPSGSSSAPVAPHGYIKYFADVFGTGSVTNLFAVTFIVRCALEYRGID